MFKWFSPKWNPAQWRLRVNASVFSICLLIAIFLWVVIKMSDTYSATVHCDLDHSTRGKDWIITGYSHQQVELSVEAKGFSLLNRLWLRSKPALKVIPENLDLLPAPLNPEYNYFILTRQLTQSLKQDVHYIGELTGVAPDTLFFLLHQKGSKKVPVNPVTDIGFAPQYHYYEDIQIHPDSVTIYGARHQLDTIHRIMTRPFVKNQVNSNVDAYLALDLPQTIQANRDSIRLRMEVVEFTEKSVRVPIDTRPFQQPGYSLKTFPGQVTITFWVALKDYERVSAAQFSASVNLENLEGEQEDRVRVTVSRFPTYVKHIRTSPREVEYVIKKDNNND